MTEKIKKICEQLGWNEFFAEKLELMAWDCHSESLDAEEFRPMLYRKLKGIDMGHNSAESLVNAITPLFF